MHASLMFVGVMVVGVVIIIILTIKGIVLNDKLSVSQKRICLPLALIIICFFVGKIINIINSSPPQVIATQSRQEKIAMLQMSVSVQPWTGIPMGTMRHLRANDPVAVSDSENIPGTGLSRVIVERQSDKHLFAVLVVSSRKIKKGEKVELMEVSYIFNNNDVRVERSLVIVK